MPIGVVPGSCRAIFRAPAADSAGPEFTPTDGRQNTVVGLEALHALKTGQLHIASARAQGRSTLPGTCLADYSVGFCTTSVNYSDTLIGNPSSYRYTVNDVDVDDGYSFEMDQDYSLTGRLNVHDSAPSCDGMKDTYSQNYGDPNWDWQPSACYEIVDDGFSGGPPEAGPRPVSDSPR